MSTYCVNVESHADSRLPPVEVLQEVEKAHHVVPTAKYQQ